MSKHRRLWLIGSERGPSYKMKPKDEDVKIKELKTDMLWLIQKSAFNMVATREEKVTMGEYVERCLALVKKHDLEELLK